MIETFLEELKQQLKAKDRQQASKFQKTYFAELKIRLQDLIVERNSFSVGSRLDSGGSGTVYKGQIFYEEVAIKVLNLGTMGFKQIANVVKEILVLSRVRHPNVISLFGVCLHKQEMFIITEYFENSSLHNYMKKNKGNMSFLVKLKILLDIAKALAYLHSLERPIIHRDIKPHNVLISNDLRAKVADFG